MIVMVAAIAGSKPDNVPKTVPTLTMSPMTFSDSVRWEAAMALLRWCYGQLAFSDKLHDLLVIRVGGVERDERGDAVDVNANAIRLTINSIYVLSVFIHVHSSELN